MNRFPERLKSHSSHDVVLLCAVCHTKANTENVIFRESLAAEVGMPVNRGTKLETMPKEMRDISTAGSMDCCCVLSTLCLGHALSTCFAKIPEARRDELMKTLQKHFGKEDITKDDMKQAGTLA